MVLVSKLRELNSHNLLSVGSNGCPLWAAAGLARQLGEHFASVFHAHVFEHVGSRNTQTALRTVISC